MSQKECQKTTSSLIITKLRLVLLYSFPAALFCSYFPLFPIAKTPSTNYELSLSLIWLFVFSILSLKDFLLHIYNTIKQLKPKHSFKAALPLLTLLFPLYLTLSAFWSVNPLRAVMTAGILWCLYISTIGCIKLVRAKAFNKDRFLKVFILTSCVFCGFCWLQSLLDVLGADRSITLLCSGCTSYSFGFPHPSGFAIEPQFMGNLLLAPSFLSLYLWLKSKSEKTIFDSKSLLAISFFIQSTLFLTFSRGAIYSFIFAFLIILLISAIRQKNRPWLKAAPLIVVSFLFTLLMQGVFSAASYTDSTFLGGIEKSISQLSLGKIEFHSPKSESSTEQEAENASSPSPVTDSAEVPVFDGYVEESTNVRMNFNRIALELATKDAKTLFFGTGLGSAGETMYKEGKTTTPFEIVQNEYLSLLLETGIVGIILATLTLSIVVAPLKKLNRPERYLLGAIIVSFLFSLLFFSGLPNAIHIYLFPAFLAATLPPNRRR